MTVSKGKDDPPSPAKGKVTAPPASANVEDEEPEFPVKTLAELDEMVTRAKWVVPVQPGAQLETLMRSAIELCRQGRSFTISCSFRLVTLVIMWLR